MSTLLIVTVRSIEASGGSRIFQRSGSANPKGGGANLLFWSILPENCMKMKKIWLGGGGRISLFFKKILEDISTQARESTLALKPRADVTTSPK